MRPIADYYKRLIRPWVNLKEIELKALPVPEKHQSVLNTIQKKEGQILLECLKKQEKPLRGVVVLLDEKGSSLPTLKWAEQIRNYELNSTSSLFFCIGSSLGFSNEIRDDLRCKMSFGPQTVSHELARVLLLEQLYRAYSILKGHPYHNA